MAVVVVDVVASNEKYFKYDKMYENYCLDTLIFIRG
jgi:hypothetical protein